MVVKGSRPLEERDQGGLAKVGSPTFRPALVGVDAAGWLHKACIANAKAICLLGERSHQQLIGGLPPTIAAAL